MIAYRTATSDTTSDDSSDTDDEVVVNHGQVAPSAEGVSAVTTKRWSTALRIENIGTGINHYEGDVHVSGNIAENAVLTVKGGSLFVAGNIGNAAVIKLEERSVADPTFGGAVKIVNNDITISGNVSMHGAVIRGGNISIGCANPRTTPAAPITVQRQAFFFVPQDVTVREIDVKGSVGSDVKIEALKEPKFTVAGSIGDNTSIKTAAGDEIIYKNGEADRKKRSFSR